MDRYAARNLSRYATAALMTWIMWGCGHNDQTTGMTHPMLPPDFALRFCVAGTGSSDHPLEQTSQYVVEPNRDLRVMVGPTATAKYYPPKSRTLQREEYYDLAQYALSSYLMSEQTSRGAGAGHPKVRYSVEITAHGHTHRYATTPDESPPTVQLLRRLVVLHTATTSGIE